MVNALVILAGGQALASVQPSIVEWAERIVRPASFILADKAINPIWEQIDPPRRAAIIMALLALTLIGLFLIVFIMVGGHWVRRLARHRPGRHGAPEKQAPIQSELRATLQSILPEAKTDDTIQFGKSSPETKAGN